MEQMNRVLQQKQADGFKVGGAMAGGAHPSPLLLLAYPGSCAPAATSRAALALAYRCAKQAQQTITPALAPP
jgi:hypothetical protein